MVSSTPAYSYLSYIQHLSILFFPQFKSKVITSNNAFNLKYFLLWLMLSITSSSLSYAASAEGSGDWEEGVTAFRQGNFPRALEIFDEYRDADGEQGTMSRIYTFAMRDTVRVKPSETVIGTIISKRETEPFFEVLEARLHLLGWHPEVNKNKGLKTLRGLSEDEGYASFTLGLYYEGKLGGTKDLRKAHKWHDTARELGYEQALSRLADIGRELDRDGMGAATAGGGDDEDDTGWDSVSTLRGKFDVMGTGSVLEGGSAYTGATKARGGAGKKPAPGMAAVYESDEEDDSTVHSDPRTTLSGAGAIPVTKPGGGAAGGAGASSAASEAALAAKIAELEAATKREAAVAAAKIAQAEAARREAEAAATREREAAAAKIAQLEAAAAAAAKARVVAPSGGSGASAATASASAGAGSGGASGAGAIVSVPRVPDIAVGHEAFYRQFLGGRLEYRPDPKSDAGLIILPFRDLLAPLVGTANPLSATFDLSGCGGAGKYLSINIGYKKAKIPANAGMVEVWLCPKFLVERELDTFKIGGGFFSSPKHPFAGIMNKWEAPMGYFWTRGGDDIKADNYDYLLNGICMDNGENLYEKWRSGHIHLRTYSYFMKCIGTAQSFLVI